MQLDPDRGIKSSEECALLASLNGSSFAHGDRSEDTSLDRPMRAFLGEFTELVLAHHVVILEAETGAGKSTLAPAHLLHHFDKIICTQPRRLLAHNLGSFVASELGVELGTVVGIRTAQTQMSDKETRLLFCTDGWAFQFLANKASREHHPNARSWWPKGEPDVLVIDEGHENNLAQESLLAHWREQYICWKAGRTNAGVRIPEPPKLVIMSATLGIEKLIGHFLEMGAEDSLAYLSVPGRQFPIQDLYNPTLDIPSHIKESAAQGRETLIFDKGKQDIAEHIDLIQFHGADTELLPLHRDLTVAQQSAAFRKYDRPRTIVSTNVAESGATPDVDEVISTGDMKVLLPNDRQGYCLEIVECPQFNLRQQRGRVGRTKPGTWILAGGRPMDQRDETLPPEIKRSPLEGMVMSFIKAGFSPMNIEFLNEGRTTKQRIQTSIDKLISFDYLTYKDGILSLTEKGKSFQSYPVRFELNVFLNEIHAIARKEEEKNPALARDLNKWGLIIAAVVEVGRIHKRCGDAPFNEKWFIFGELANVTNNDVLAHTKLFLKTHELFTKLKEDFDKESNPRISFEEKVAERFEHLHLELKKYQQLIDMLDMMTKGDASRFMPIPRSIPENGTQTRLLDCLIKAFKHQLYLVADGENPQKGKKGNGKYYQKPTNATFVRNIDSRDDSELYEIVKSALINRPTANERVMGLPFSLQKDSGEIVHLLQFPVVISQQRLKAVLGS